MADVRLREAQPLERPKADRGQADVVERYRADASTLVAKNTLLAAGLYSAAAAVLVVVDMAVRREELGNRGGLVGGYFGTVLCVCGMFLSLSRTQAMGRRPIEMVMAWWVILLGINMTYFTMTNANRSLVAFWVIGTGMTAALLFPWGRAQSVLVAAGVLSYIGYVTVRSQVPATPLPVVYDIAAVLTISMYSLVGALIVDRMRFEKFTQHERLQAHDKREQVVRAKEVSIHIAHQITPIHGAIGIYAASLAGSEHKEVRELAGKVQACLDEAKQISNSISAFIRSGTTHPRPSSITSVLTDAIKASEVRASSKGVSIRVVDRTDGAVIVMDPKLAAQALQNIIDNAVDASTASQHVQVEARIDGGWLDISVRDHGPGLDDEIAENLLTPFISSKPGGVGLGLVFCNEVVTAHRGNLSWRKEHPGLTFTIRLPLR